MTEMLLTGVGLLALMATWKWMWLPTVLDSTRDTLFDLRDNVLREYFVSREISLEHPIYLKLRTLLNGHLRHTESLTIGEYSYLQVHLEKEKELTAKKIAQGNRKFKVQDPDLQALIDEIRYKSSVAMVTYMIESSLLSMVLALFVFPIVAFKEWSFNAIFSTKPVVKARTVMEKYAMAA